MRCYLCIVGANIFLSDDSVKLGDFGLSVQLRNLNKTAPQEVKHQRGTIRMFLSVSLSLSLSLTLTLSLSLPFSIHVTRSSLKTRYG